MGDARAKLKDLGDRIQAAMDRHGITMAEITVRRFRWRMREFAQVNRALTLAIDEACFSVREMSEGLLMLNRRMKRK